MILETKLTLPQPKAGALVRKGLIDLIKNNLDKKLILITAGAGYGKTTLLAQLIGEVKRPCLYYSLDAGDGNLTTFYAHLIRGLEAMNLGALRRCRNLMTAASGGEQDRVLLFGTLINELMENNPGEMVLCFDDYHNIGEDSRVHRDLEYFINYAPSSVHLVIATRTQARFGALPAWITKGQAYELAPENFCFSESDITELLKNICSTGWNQEDIRQLRDYTEGWITGILMIAKNVAAGGPGKLSGILSSGISDQQVLLRYLTDEIFARENKRARGLLLSSSILEDVCAAECDVIFGLKNSAGVLERMERRNIFIFKTGRGQYRYHRLFHEYLYWQLSGTPLKTRLHLQAAEYYRKTGEPEKAIGHYLKAGNYRAACRAINRVIEPMFHAAKYATLQSWFNIIPAEYLESEPRVKLEKAMICRVYGRLDEAETLLDQVRRKFGNRAHRQKPLCAKSSVLAETLMELARIAWIRQQHDQAMIYLNLARRACPGNAQEYLAYILNSLGVISGEMNDWADLRRYCAMALRVYPRNRAGGSLYLSIEYNLTMALCAQGEIIQGLERYKALFQRIKGKYSVGIGAKLSHMSDIALMSGETDWSRRFLAEAESIYLPFKNPQDAASLDMGYGSLEAYQEQWERALMRLEAARKEFKNQGRFTEECAALRKLAWVHRVCGRYDDAGKCLEQAKGLIRRRQSLDWIYCEIESVWLDLALSNFDGLDERLRHLANFARRFGYLPALFKTRLCAAGLCFRRHDEVAGAKHLAWAAAISSKKGFKAQLAYELRSDPELYKASKRLGIGLDATGQSGRQTSSFVALAEPIDLRINFFGVLRISLASGREAPMAWRSRKAESLLAYLVLHRDRVCFREELMDSLWPRSDVKHADQSLRAWVSQIKKDAAQGFSSCGALSAARTPIIVHQERGYRINPAFRINVDAEEFMANWEEARRDLKDTQAAKCADFLGRCLNIYTDRFLVNLGEKWCEERREKYELLYARIAISLANLKLDAGEHEQAIGLFKQYIDREQFNLEIREDVHRLYWRSLGALGRKKEIGQDYKKMADLLRKEYDSEPRPETIEAYQNIIKDIEPLR